MIPLVISSRSHSRFNLGTSSFALSHLVRVNKFNRSIYVDFNLAAKGSIPWPLLTTNSAAETEESVNLKMKGSASQGKARNFAASQSSLETRPQN